MWHTIKEFWTRYRVFVLENKLRALRVARLKVTKRAERVTVKYERYRTRLVEMTRQ